MQDAGNSSNTTVYEDEQEEKSLMAVLRDYYMMMFKRMPNPLPDNITAACWLGARNMECESENFEATIIAEIAEEFVEDNTRV